MYSILSQAFLQGDAGMAAAMEVSSLSASPRGRITARQWGVPPSSSTGSLASSAGGAVAESEVARFGAAKEKKLSLEAGIALFNRCVSALWLTRRVESVGRGNLAHTQSDY